MKDLEDELSEVQYEMDQIDSSDSDKYVDRYPTKNHNKLLLLLLFNYFVLVKITQS